MDINDIKRFSGEKKVPVGIIEKDYVLSCMLVLLACSEIKDHIVFKGGTAIKKMYFPDARFSVDLDFNYVDIKIDKLKKEISSLIKSNVFGSVEFVRIKNEFESKKKDVYRCMIEYKGLLEHKINQSIRLDFNCRENSIIGTQYKHIIDDYSDEITQIGTMAIDEMFAEKCRALITRKEQKSKDLFDVYFLINKGVVIDKTLIDKKLVGYHEKFNEHYFDQAISDITNIWKRDLQDLLPHGDIPDFDKVASFVRKKLF